MRIEDELMGVNAPAPSRHKDVLRARLLAQMKEKSMKKKQAKKWLVLSAVPIAALLLIAVVNVWRPDGKTPEIVKQVTDPLTAKEVFAVAAENIAGEPALRPDEVRYLKLSDDYIAHDSKGNNDPRTPCTKIKGFTELYINHVGQEVMRRALTAEGELFHSYRTNYGSEGQPLPAGNVYFDQALKDRSHQQIACPVYDYPDSLDKELEGYDWETASTREDREDKGIFDDLMSGVGTRQMSALLKLQESDYYSIAQNQHIAGYPTPVIRLSKNENTYWYQAYFFDQTTKEFIGLQRHEQSQVIIEQSIRKAVSLPIR